MGKHNVQAVQMKESSFAWVLGGRMERSSSAAHIALCTEAAHPC
jgi:hypothetical protein